MGQLYEVLKIDIFESCSWLGPLGVLVHQKKGLSGSRYMPPSCDRFIFRVPKSWWSNNNLVTPLRWDVRTVEFVNLSLKLSLPAQFP